MGYDTSYFHDDNDGVFRHSILSPFVFQIIYTESFVMIQVASSSLQALRSTGLTSLLLILLTANRCFLVKLLSLGCPTLFAPKCSRLLLFGLDVSPQIEKNKLLNVLFQTYIKNNNINLTYHYNF